MKRGLMAAAVLVVAFAVPVWAADSGPAEKGAQVKGVPDLKERKGQILKGIDERIAGLQKDRKCVQAAKTDAELQGCRQQSQGAREDRGRDRGPRRDMDRMRTPGGPAPVPGAVPAPPAQGK